MRLTLPAAALDMGLTEFTPEDLRAQILLVPPTEPGSPPDAVSSIGIVLMTKKPFDFESWLTYHHEVVGVHRFFVRVEGTPELEPLLARAPWCDLVDAVFATENESRDVADRIGKRQRAHIAWAVPRARAAGCTHLLHIDDDELVYCAGGAPRLLATLSAAPPGVDNLHLCNMEALAPAADESPDPFREVRAFRHDPRGFTCYCNGKGFGRLDEPGLRAAGPSRRARTAAYFVRGSPQLFRSAHALSRPNTAQARTASRSTAPDTRASGSRRGRPLCCTTSVSPSARGGASSATWPRATSGTLPTQPVGSRRRSRCPRTLGPRPSPTGMWDPTLTTPLHPPHCPPTLRYYAESIGACAQLLRATRASDGAPAHVLQAAEADARAVWRRLKSPSLPADELERIAASEPAEGGMPLVIDGGVTLVTLPAFGARSSAPLG
jgi:hypothetical protein